MSKDLQVRALHDKIERSSRVRAAVLRLATAGVVGSLVVAIGWSSTVGLAGLVVSLFVGGVGAYIPGMHIYEWKVQLHELEED